MDPTLFSWLVIGGVVLALLGYWWVLERIGDTFEEQDWPWTKWQRDKRHHAVREETLKALAEMDTQFRRKL